MGGSVSKTGKIANVCFYFFLQKTSATSYIDPKLVKDRFVDQF